MTVAEDIHRVTVDEYVRIVREFGWERTELVEGVVYDVSAEYNRHASAVMQVFRQLDARFPGGATYPVGSVHVSSISMFDPDVYVVDPAIQLDPDGAVPAAAVRIAVEVMVSSHSRDRGPKLMAYAKAGVPELWLIDPRPEVAELVRHRDPEGASYRTVDRFAVGENASTLDVAAVLER